MFRSFRHQSGLILPLLIEDRVAGGFYIVWWTARRRFEERELRMLDHVCEQVGLLLRNASLYEEAERNRHRLEVLNDVSRQLAAVHDTDEVLTLIVNQAARLVKAEAAGLRLLEGDDLVVGARTESAAPLMIRPRIKLGESLTGKVVAGGGTTIIDAASMLPTRDRVLTVAAGTVSITNVTLRNGSTSGAGGGILNKGSPTRRRRRSRRRACSARPSRASSSSPGSIARRSRCRAPGTARSGSGRSCTRRARCWASTA